jgi:hypothetical protein
LRLWLHKIITWKHFDSIIIAVIVVSSIVLAIDNPLNDPESEMTLALYYIDIVITAVFVGEFVAKTVVWGFVANGDDSYIRNGWNMLDFLIVVISLVSLGMQSDQLSKLKALRTFRVLKPLRMLGRNENMKLAVNSLIKSLPNIGNVLILCMFFWLLTGIICVNYFKGKLFHCDLSEAPAQREPDIIDKQD